MIGVRSQIIFVSTILIAFVMSLLPALAQIKINEVQWSNKTFQFPDAKGTPDWVELINIGGRPVDIGEIYISDDLENRLKFNLPNRVIEPGSLQIIYLSGDNKPDKITPEGDPISSDTDLENLIFSFSVDSIDISNKNQVTKFNNTRYLRKWDGVIPGGAIYLDSTALSTSPKIVTQLDDSYPSEIMFDGNDDLMRFRGFENQLHEFTWTFVASTSSKHQMDQVELSGIGGVKGQKYLFWPEHGGGSGAGVGVSIGTNGLSVYEHGSGYMPARLAYQRDLNDSFNIFSFSYSGGKCHLFVNGVFWGASEKSLRDSIMAPLSIGGGPYGYFSGAVKYISAYSRALSGREIAQLHKMLAIKYEVGLFNPIKVPFKLKNGEEPVVLTSKDGEQIDLINPIVMPQNFSFGRSASDFNELGIFNSPTPGFENGMNVYKGWLKELQLSHQAGFYKTAFDLQASSEDVGIEFHYTLDGSDPGMSDSVMSAGQLHIDSSLRAKRDLMDIKTSHAWLKPISTWHRGIVLSVRAFKDGYIPSSTKRRTFFIHSRGNQMVSLPVFSIIVNKEDFFGEERGIYIQGNDPQGNFWNKGREWERQAFVEFFEPGKPVSFSQNMGVRIFGGTSRQFPQKSLRFYTKRNATNRPLVHNLFFDSERDVFDKFILRQSGHDHHFTFIRDGFMTAIGREAGLDTQLFRPCFLFINGEFWGIHNLRESFDEGYFESHHSVEPEELNIVEGFYRSDVGDDSSLAKLGRDIDSGLLDKSVLKESIDSVIDVENFLTYKAIETFFYRWDTGNLKRWKSDHGKWRWLWFDTDVGSGGFASIPPAWNFPMLEYNLESNGAWDRYPLNNHNNPTMTRMFRSVIEIPDWKEYFINRYCDLLNSILKEELLLNKINELQTNIRPYMIHQIRRWNRPSSLSEWNSQLDHLKEFASKRQAPAFRHLQAYFNLGDLHSLEIEEPNSKLGEIEINSLQFDESYEKFSGTYFSDIPISIKVRPRDGVDFLGWEEIPGTRATELKLQLRGDTKLTPIFSSSIEKFKLCILSNDGGKIELGLEPEIKNQNRRWVLEFSNDLKSWSTIKQGLGSFKVQTIPSSVAGSQSQFYRLSLF